MNNLASEKSNNAIKQALNAIIDSNPTGIRAFVASEALQQDNPISFLHNVIEHGCRQGFISSLVDPVDTHAFFDQHYDEIEIIREEYDSLPDETFIIEGDLRTCLSQLAFEETALGILIVNRW